MERGSRRSKRERRIVWLQRQLPKQTSPIPEQTYLRTYASLEREEITRRVLCAGKETTPQMVSSECYSAGVKQSSNGESISLKMVNVL